MVRRAVAALRELPGVDVVDVDGARVHWPDAWALVRASQHPAGAGAALRGRRPPSGLHAVRARSRRATRDRSSRRVIAAVEVRARAAASLEFFYDLASPYSYLAATQLAGLAERTGANVRWRPMVLGRVARQASGSRPGRARPGCAICRRTCALGAQAAACRCHFPSRFPMNTMQALRLCVQAQERSEALHQALALRLFRAYWAEDEDLLDERRARARCSADVGLPAGELARPAAARRGQGGAAQPDRGGDRARRLRRPSFFVGGELFWGNDRLDFVEAALRYCDQTAAAK